jgi:FAD/FMN-containing dehydrogenase
VLANEDGWRLNTVQQTFVLPSEPFPPNDPWGASPTAEFLKAAYDDLRPRGLRPIVVDVLHLPKDDHVLSSSRNMEGFAVTLAFADRDGEQWSELSGRLRSFSARCRELGGRVHLVKNVEADQGDLKAMYGSALDDFRALKRRYDPKGILKNAFFEKIFGLDA